MEAAEECGRGSHGFKRSIDRLIMVNYLDRKSLIRLLHGTGERSLLREAGSPPRTTTWMWAWASGEPAAP
jgi:hypothetical protein